METRSPLDGESFERFRPYLRHLAQVAVDGRLRRKVDASDIVQDTLLQAYKARGDLRGGTRRDVAAWLREILANRINREYRDHYRQKRDIRREQSLEQFLGESSADLERLIPGRHSSPSGYAQREELALRVAELLEQLPERERFALVEQKLAKRSLADIAGDLECSEPTVVRLIRRALEHLRGSLADL